MENENGGNVLADAVYLEGTDESYSNDAITYNYVTFDEYGYLTKRKCRNKREMYDP